MISQTIGRGLYAGRVYPSGDFTIGRVSKLPVATRDEETHPLAGIREDSYFHEGEKHKIYDYDDRQPHLGLSVATNSHKTRTKRGQTGITGLGKRKIRSAAAIVGKHLPKKLISFLTCTTPTVSREESDQLCANWHEITRQFNQELHRELERSGVTNTDLFYVTEIQSKRYMRDGILGLHLHIVFQGKLRAKDNWAISTAKVTEIWRRILENQLGRSLNCDYATKLESPRGNLAREMGKYLSKGGKILNVVKGRGDGHLLPASWWGMSRSITRKINKAIRKLEGDSAIAFLDSLRNLSDSGDITYRQICLEQYGGLCVGWGGYVKNLALLEILLE